MRFCTLAIFVGFWAMAALADTVEIKVYKIIPNTNASTIELGTISATDTEHGLLLTPNLKNLPPGIHGMHLHQNPSCADNGMAAGPHFDPQRSGKHLGPYNQGELGDLPALTVTTAGNAELPVLAPRLKVADIKGHSVIIHAGGDNYSDQPPLGGGGARIACGIIPQ